ncbi:DUF2946 domain-containing protein [Rubrivivax rivuli]|uniref:DUF2946 domain-containing protein n=1 Tax=Rubrivivax rivuli TaxID=1862385 RepID=A0A437RQG0_9BURK|nr:DUF2946 domain-containing protein [Rubrivivax rivuli]RVU49034.1 DUF2946 domain-containing protein [Rubrivivax rivuli]
MHRRHLRPLTWLALWAVLAMALLPAVSHALSFARGDGGAWAEVCTPQGMRWVLVEAPDGPAPSSLPTATGHLEHCSLCTLSAGAAAPPPALPVLLALSLAAFEPPLFLHAPRTLFAWRTAQPRGPPFVS